MLAGGSVMNKIKSFAKELRVFGIVLICVFGLFVYKKINLNDYIHISDKKVIQMIDKEKSFILVLGNSTLPSSNGSNDKPNPDDPGIQTHDQHGFHKEYIKEHHQKVYYLDTKKVNDLENFTSTYLTTSTTVPQTLFIKDGKVIMKKEGPLKYVEFSKMADEWKKS